MPLDLAELVAAAHHPVQAEVAGIDALDDSGHLAHVLAHAAAETDEQVERDRRRDQSHTCEQRKLPLLRSDALCQHCAGDAGEFLVGRQHAVDRRGRLIEIRLGLDVDAARS
ncbi:hypothetical protein [Cupriavidus sp. CP313]